MHPGGWDHRTFRLGADLAVRLPSADAYALQGAVEHRWLPRLAGRLPLEIPTSVALGRPGSGFPWGWSVRRWIEGEVAQSRGKAFARVLGEFLHALHRIPADEGPASEVRNFHRGGDLGLYGAEVERALVVLEGRVDDRAVMALWRAATSTRWGREPVWVHGDIAPANLLERDGRLTAIIDFGNLAIGDPACDTAIAWTWLARDSRDEFRTAAGLDEATWMRGRAWALWKALIVAAGLAATNAAEFAAPLGVIENCLAG